MKRSSEDWLKQPEFEGYQILDPDGWDRRNFVASWAQEITYDEFQRRLVQSTVRFPRRILKQRALEAIIDNELAQQARVQDGCTYHHYDDVGVAVATMNIVIPQLARRILEYLDD